MMRTGLISRRIPEKDQREIKKHGDIELIK